MSFEAVMPPYNAGDPTATFLSASCLDFLLIELVPMAYRVTNELEEASASSATATTTSDKDKDAAPAPAPPRAAMDEEEERDAVFYRLETLGYRVGQGLVERYVFLFLFSSSSYISFIRMVWCGISDGSLHVTHRNPLPPNPFSVPPFETNNSLPKSSARKVGT